MTSPSNIYDGICPEDIIRMEQEDEDLFPEDCEDCEDLNLDCSMCPVGQEEIRAREWAQQEEWERQADRIRERDRGMD